jgi:peptidoglycan pentaglycine glycine transferase (the first glycine)
LPFNAGLVQILFREKGPMSVGYVPRGPAWSDEAIVPILFAAIDEVSASHRAIHTTVELDRTVGSESMPLGSRWSVGGQHVQPGRTVKVDLASDDEMLKRMHQKTRYSVRLAMRKGVEVEQYAGMEEGAFEQFYALLSETSERNEFGIHSRTYYQDFLEIFDQDALLLIAKIGGNPAAGLIAAGFGSEAIYMYGGSSSRHRAHGAAFLLQFEAMRWARDAGRKRYDLWGIPKQDPASEEGLESSVPATRGEDWRGLYRFKTGFGGEIVEYPAPLEHRYRPFASKLARKIGRSLA